MPSCLARAAAKTWRTLYQEYSRHCGSTSRQPRRTVSGTRLSSSVQDLRLPRPLVLVDELTEHLVVIGKPPHQDVVVFGVGERRPVPFRQSAGSEGRGLARSRRVRGPPQRNADGRARCWRCPVPGQPFRASSCRKELSASKVRTSGQIRVGRPSDQLIHGSRSVCRRCSSSSRSPGG